MKPLHVRSKSGVWCDVYQGESVPKARERLTLTNKIFHVSSSKIEPLLIHPIDVDTEYILKKFGDRFVVSQGGSTVFLKEISLQDNTFFFVSVNEVPEDYNVLSHTFLCWRLSSWGFVFRTEKVDAGLLKVTMSSYPRASVVAKMFRDVI